MKKLNIGLTIALIATGVLLGCVPLRPQPKASNTSSPVIVDLTINASAINPGDKLKLTTSFYEINGSTATTTFSVSLPSGVSFVGEPPQPWSGKLKDGEVITREFEVLIESVVLPPENYDGTLYPFIRVGAIDTDGNFIMADYEYVYVRPSRLKDNPVQYEVSTNRFFGNPEDYRNKPKPEIYETDTGTVSTFTPERVLTLTTQP